MILFFYGQLERNHQFYFLSRHLLCHIFLIHLFFLFVFSYFCLFFASKYRIPFQIIRTNANSIKVIPFLECRCSPYNFILFQI